MRETKNGKQIFSLYEVAVSIQNTIAKRYSSAYWIKAELNKLNHYRHSGHCYPELVEKKEGKVIAQIRSILWRDDYQRINHTFTRVLNEPLKDGIKILLLATIQFHPEYGLSLQITDIDPAFTLGDLEREKQETIERLKTEGIYNRNKLLPFPLLPRRIAIISVETSKGYADFSQVLHTAQQSWRYAFFHLLFPSLLQSDKAVQSIMNQLNRIRKVIHHFDVVAIIRGGGGDIGLSCYNNYSLAKAVALFPIPVITGIGHSTNETVVELVAFENAITPTKLAEFLIQKFHDFSIPVQKAEETLMVKSRSLIENEKIRFQLTAARFRLSTTTLLLKKDHSLQAIGRRLIRGATAINTHHLQMLRQFRQAIEKDLYYHLRQKLTGLDYLRQRLANSSKTILKNRISEITRMEKNIINMHPDNILKRGYSITLLNGKPVTSHTQLEKGDQVTTILYEGRVSSTVNTTSKSTEP